MQYLEESSMQGLNFPKLFVKVNSLGFFSSCLSGLSILIGTYFFLGYEVVMKLKFHLIDFIDLSTFRSFM